MFICIHVVSTYSLFCLSISQFKFITNELPRITISDWTLCLRKCISVFIAWPEIYVCTCYFDLFFVDCWVIMICFNRFFAFAFGLSKLSRAIMVSILFFVLAIYVSIKRRILLALYYLLHFLLQLFTLYIELTKLVHGRSFQRHIQIDLILIVSSWYWKWSYSS